MARTFNGTNQSISMASVPLSPNDAVISLAAWIKTSSTAGVVFASDNGSSARFCQFKVITSKLQLILFAAGASRTWTGTSNVNTGAWVHVGCSYDGTTGILYVNGVGEGSAALSATIGSDARNWRFGAQIAGVSQSFFTGPIAHGAMWKRALAAAEFKSLADGLLPSHLAPDHYWPLWGTDSPEPDIGTVAKVAGTLDNNPVFASGSPTSMELLTLA